LPALVIAASVLFFCCQTEEIGKKPPANPNPQGLLVLEAEDFRLIEAEVVDDAGASNGKAVKILSQSAFCSTEFSLPPGTYIVNTRAKAFDPAHDLAYLSVGRDVIPINPVVYNQYAYCPQYLEFTITQAGKSFIQFATFASGKPMGDTDLVIDFFEIWEKDRWRHPGMD
jgi:hypothetical protein